MSSNQHNRIKNLIDGETNWSAFCRHLQFLVWKLWYFDSNVTEVCSWVPLTKSVLGQIYGWRRSPKHWHRVAHDTFRLFNNRFTNHLTTTISSGFQGPRPLGRDGGDRPSRYLHRFTNYAPWDSPKHIAAKAQWPPLFRPCFQIHFLDEKVFWSNVTAICSEESNQQLSSIILINILPPSWWPILLSHLFVTD